MKYFAILFLMSSAAYAQQGPLITMPSQTVCGPDDVFKKVFEDYVPTMRGRADTRVDNSFGEVWQNPKNGHWIFVQVVTAEKMMCVLLGGETPIEPLGLKTQGKLI